MFSCSFTFGQKYINIFLCKRDEVIGAVVLLYQHKCEKGAKR